MSGETEVSQELALVSTAIINRNRVAVVPPGIEVHPLYNRSDLVNRTLHTVETNLFEGALLVVAILFALLGNFRAACIVALAIPLAMLFAITGMVESRVSGNLMSLGAIDFGLIIDGAVVMVENILRHLAHKQRELGRELSTSERRQEVLYSAREVANPMFFGVLIITVVYFPILALTGIEGKMFRPMALTVMFALAGSLVLALTLMPALCAYFLRGKINEQDNWLVRLLKAIYTPLLNFALRFRWRGIGRGGGAVRLVAVGLHAAGCGVHPATGRRHDAASIHPQQQRGAGRFGGLAEEVREAVAGKVPRD